MINIVVNMIIEWLDAETEKPLLERVLWIDPHGEAIFVISINDPKSLPLLRTRSEIESALQQEIATPRTVDPYSALAAPSQQIPANHLKVRDRVWDRIRGLVSQEPEIYFEERRKQLIMNDPVASKGAVDKVYNCLRKYWKRGMIKNALLPDYANSGAPGKQRGIREGRKRGRKPKVVLVNPEFIGVNVDDGIRRIFNIAFKRYYNSRKKNPLKRAYDEMVRKHFNLGHRNQNGRDIPVTPPAHLVPTLGQFVYWYHRQKNLVHSIVSREGRRAYELRHRPVLGDSTQAAFGPGSIYQIDATVADIYLVSQLDRIRIIGRPVIYFCIDVFSRLCVGLYVGLEGPSWLTGMMALANTTADKVGFCAEFGIEISAEDWPGGLLPEQITADRGEFIGISSDQLVDGLNITFTNCPPFRGDLKGIVEQYFRRANDTCVKWIPGAVRKREQGEPDYRLDATLTISEFTRTLILMVIEYNLFHRIDDYPMGKDMMGDGVEPVPIDLWNWGIVNRSGHLRERSPDAVKLALLPRDSATITLKGIRFNGMFYICERAIREQWFVKARHSGNWVMEASYDPRKPEVIYLNPGNGVLEPCQLLPRDERFKDFRIEEILEYQEVQKQNSALHKSVRMQSRGELSAVVEAEVGEALARTEEAKARQAGVSDNARLKGIRKNRQDEKERIREEEAWDMRADGGWRDGQGPAEVVTLPVEDALDAAESLTASKRKRFLEAIERSENEEGNA
ncbi:MAG: DDE-type integrase/transposase/recombinase [Oryzomonas sp.]|uniref:DDE-type integrase/transposase/recombinase n=1 Tax=Oryzomonas sp. TaxID=2855186 RepID=UPI0028422FBF|nr:DDE-type integrase/transposase/recombinase [Oryzomonas sp.]MDR3579209.1 DDE-type integrase/transposase/recombinase [Oryzomonas sp.]